ncbi:MAG: hypothetical protein WCW17_03395 [Patescibacteria group bacterium]
MDKIFSFYNDAIARFSPSIQGIISIIVAIVLITILIKLIKRNLILFVILLVIFFPVAWPAIIKIWHYIYEIIIFLLAKW